MRRNFWLLTFQFAIVSFVSAVGMMDYRWLDNYFEIGLCLSIIFHGVAGVLFLIALFKMKKAPTVSDGKLFTPWLLVGIAPAIMIWVITFGYTDTFRSAPVVIVSFFNVVATVLYEELVFRHFGRLLFEKDGKYSVASVVVMVLFYGFTRIVNLQNNSVGETFIQIGLAAAGGLFYIGLYAVSKNLVVPMVAHFSASIVSVIFSLFASDQTFFNASLPVAFIYMATVATCGAYMLIRYRLVRKCDDEDEAEEECKPEGKAATANA